MWRVALGIVVCLQVGAVQAGEGEGAGHVDEKTGRPPGCPGVASGETAGEDCAPDDVVPGSSAAELPAAPAAELAAATSRAAFATVSFRNDVGTKLRLVEAHFTMDGADLPIVLTGPERGKSYVIVSGAMQPGPHVVTARLTYQGEQRVFSYMKGYKFNVRAEQVLTAPENRVVSFTVVGSENKGITVPLDRRLVVKVEENAVNR